MTFLWACGGDCEGDGAGERDGDLGGGGDGANSGGGGGGDGAGERDGDLGGGGGGGNWGIAHSYRASWSTGRVCTSQSMYSTNRSVSTKSLPWGTTVPDLMSAANCVHAAIRALTARPWNSPVRTASCWIC
jgi:hypothetical protein